MISFFAAGIPKGQPRPRAFARKFGNTYSARVYDPGTAEGWKAQVALAAKASLYGVFPLPGPLGVSLAFYMPRPKGHFGKKGLKASAPSFPTGKPDVDNLAKAVLDALTQVGMWVDDAQIITLMVSKHYGQKTGCQIQIEELSEVPV